MLLVVLFLGGFLVLAGVWAEHAAAEDTGGVLSTVRSSAGAGRISAAPDTATATPAVLEDRLRSRPPVGQATLGQWAPAAPGPAAASVRDEVRAVVSVLAPRYEAADIPGRLPHPIPHAPGPLSPVTLPAGVGAAGEPGGDLLEPATRPGRTRPAGPPVLPADSNSAVGAPTADAKPVAKTGQLPSRGRGSAGWADSVTVPAAARPHLHASGDFGGSAAPLSPGPLVPNPSVAALAAGHADGAKAQPKGELAGLAEASYPRLPLLAGSRLRDAAAPLPQHPHHVVELPD